MEVDLIERQQALESEAADLGADRYQRARPMPWRDEASKGEEEANLPPGKHLLRMIVKPTAEVIAHTIDEASKGAAGRGHKAMSLLILVKPDVVAYITARCAVNAVAKRFSMQQLATMVAEAVRDEVNYEAIRKKEPGFYRSIMRANRKAGNYSKTWRTKVHRAMKAVEQMLVTWPKGDKIAIGTRLLEMLVSAVPDLFEIVQEPNPMTRRDEWLFRPTEKTLAWLEKQHSRCSLLNPMHMPMVVPPKPWTSPTEGAYLKGTRKLIKGGSREYLDELALTPMPKVYEALNAIQSVPWRINVQVLEVMRSLWDSGARLAVLPSRDPLPIPPKPHDIDTNEAALAAWKAKAAPVYQENARSKGQRLTISQLIWLAEKFAPEQAIYFPHELDFRGRVYPIPAGGPNPQGDDLQKALLEFSEGKPLGYIGAQWLAIHVANLFGIDKVDFDERVGWVMENQDLILDSAADPIGGRRFWMEADSPWCALAACIEWAGFVAEGPGYVSRLPIALDGSNSGLQHFSAMLRDPHGASLVNLVPGLKPADIYMSVARRVQQMADETDDPKAAPWKNGKVVRRVAKRPVMTYCYSATRFGMQDMILDELRKIDSECAAEGKPPLLNGEDNYAAANWLSHAIYAAIGVEVVAASGAMEWLRQVAQVVAQAGLPLRWTSPIGLPVLQDYRVPHGQRVDVHFNGQLIRFRVDRPTEEIDTRSQASAVAPNFVHSCDASHLMAAVRRARAAGIASLAVIHDSFGTHAADTDTLAGILRETLIEQYEPNVLARFYREVTLSLPPEVAAEIPPPPAMGTLDLSVIREAQYAFA
jgi:DNA-directed RNA polymerase